MMDEKGYSLYKPIFETIPAHDDKEGKHVPEQYIFTIYLRVQSTVAKDGRAAKSRVSIDSPLNAENLFDWVDLPYDDLVKGSKVYLILGGEALRQHPSKQRAKDHVETLTMLAFPPKMVGAIQRGQELPSELPFAHRTKAIHSAVATPTSTTPPTMAIAAVATAFEPTAKRPRFDGEDMNAAPTTATAPKTSRHGRPSKFDQQFTVAHK
jgi:hypothetical protein